MDFQATRPWVALVAATMGAHERLFSSVGKLVCLQMTFCDELLIALWTPKRPLSSVCPHMSFEVPSFWELLQALLKRTEEDFLLILGSFHLFNASYKCDEPQNVVEKNWRKGAVFTWLEADALKLSKIAAVPFQRRTLARRWAASIPAGTL